MIIIVIVHFYCDERYCCPSLKKLHQGNYCLLILFNKSLFTIIIIICSLIINRNIKAIKISIPNYNVIYFKLHIFFLELI